MSEIWDEERKINYGDIGALLFASRKGRQQMIPFLGSGVSVSDRPAPAPPMPAEFPSEETMATVCGLLGLSGQARIYLEYAVRTAILMQAWQAQNGRFPSRDAFAQQLRDAAYPPFAWELAEYFSLQSAYTSLEERPLRTLKQKRLLPDPLLADHERLLEVVKLMASVTEVTSATDPLPSIAEYYQFKSERDRLCERLGTLFANYTTPTETHRLIADAARLHLKSSIKDDYLIVTTNYDALMERAFDEMPEKIPYVVVTGRKDRRVHVKFRNLDAETIRELEELNDVANPKPPASFHLKTSGIQFAIIYKMHGCLNPDVGAPDGIVITEADYVSFISNINEMVPAQVGQMFANTRLLFLGYSFSDWNVRSIYETLTRRSGDHVRDYAVTKSLSRFEQTYFEKRNVVLVLQSLKDFTSGMRREGMQR